MDYTKNNMWSFFPFKHATIPGSVAVQFHGSSKRLLRRLRHGIGLIQDDDFVTSTRESHLLLSEHFNAVSDDVYAALVRCVQFQYSVLKGSAEKDP